MDALMEHITLEMLISAGVLVAAYILIFTEVIHRANAALIGAVVMVGAGTWFGFYTQEQAVTSIDGNTMFLLSGMMIMVAMIRPTGGIEYLAIKVAKLAAKSPTRLLVYLCLAVSVTSMLLDNVTTVIIFAPLTVLICRIQKINPLPYLMAEAMTSNIGGIATLVGDPPNIMIGSAAHIDFNTFLYHMGPIVAVIWAGVIALILWQFRGQLAPPAGLSGSIGLDEKTAIKEPVNLKYSLIALLIVLLLFLVHHLLHIYPSYVTFIGVAIGFALIRPDPDKILRQLEWPVLMFFAALFIIVGGVQHSGLLELIGNSLAQFARDPEQLLLTCLILMWVAALLSTVLDNIPFTITMIPIVLNLESVGVDATPLWWALALGVGLGGNGTHIGATANIICVTESERCDLAEARITPGLWLRKGIPVMLASLVLCSLIFTVFFDFFL
jgi:Na+/H+ antiporter NhaD/arsenite permease-like protein